LLAPLEFGEICGWEGVSDDDEEVEVAFRGMGASGSDWTVWILMGICSVLRKERIKYYAS
jgi:hypothetical protein